MKSAPGTVAGAAALKAARAALAPFAKHYSQISSIQGHDNAPHFSYANANLPRNSKYADSPSIYFISKAEWHSQNARSPPTYAEIAAYGIANKSSSLPAVPRQRPDRANRQAAALFNVPHPGRIVFIRLCFFGFNQTAPIANMAILRRALADADYRGSSVLVALEDSTILVGLPKNTIESFEKAVLKVVTSFSTAILQLVFEIQPDFKWFSEDARPALQPPSIRWAVAKELDRLSAVASA